MRKDNSIQVIYIAGNGHSGSTLLDIILGSGEESFSAGELTFITRETIMEEYCSCKNLIPECEIWTAVMERWLAESELSYEHYKQCRLRYQRNKTTHRALYNHFWPSKKFKQYCRSTLKLFQAIQEVTEKSVIIDSSKSPQRIAVLSGIIDLQVIHICRDFTGVLNSSKRSTKKDIEAGIEEESPKRKTWKVLRDWLDTNIFTEIFSFGVKYRKIFYKNYVQQLESLQKIHPSFKHITSDNDYSAPHMIAGNKIRLKEGLKIDPDVGFKIKTLT